ncbi:hypothetical protein [Winogradskyella marincola]|uniref:PLD-like domain-containing protein n=1 Tax=Winogradskyella marincola TaxID=3037795 RepID=A0ABT6G3F3_9FLAO|nr:hypothetical protein [Winogradskyella sp. YYF002]MDG4716523.1 hypothetical protein [Winogradskyella sp. YYF002]
MDIQEIHIKLDKQCPSDYKINEIIQFAYPYRRVRVNATVNKSPEKSIQQVYSVLLRTIKAGYNKEEQIIEFLGLNKEDFVLRELYFLRERGFVDFASGIWLVTEQGEEFVKDNSILKILEEEEFEFLIDGISNEALNKDFNTYQVKQDIKRLPSEITYPNRNPELLKDRSVQLSDIYKNKNEGAAYLIDYDKSNIRFDSENKEFCLYYFIEYVPIKERENELEPYMEIRNIDKDISKQKRVTGILKNRHQELIDLLSDSERTSFSKIQEENLEVFKSVVEEHKLIELQTLSVWETQEKFAEALKTVKSKILIESPWIKRATLKYIEAFEQALKRNVNVIVLYGIEEKDEHHRKAEKEMERLASLYENFHLIHLPTHFDKIGNFRMTGTHKKLIIKDNDYYINGSFNFLSFNKEQGQKIANEESTLIPQNVEMKWENTLKEYEINLNLK